MIQTALKWLFYRNDNPLDLNNYKKITMLDMGLEGVGYFIGFTRDGTDSNSPMAVCCVLFPNRVRTGYYFHDGVIKDLFTSPFHKIFPRHHLFCYRKDLNFLE